MRDNGFVHALYLSDHLPATVISKRVIQDCPERLVAEKYFDNKIAGEELFAIGKEEFLRSRAAITRAACEALKVNEPWPDGVSHEILNVVSDELFPDWVECLYQHIASGDKGNINLDYFTAASFRRPPQKILGLIRQKQQSKGIDTLGTAMLLFLEKNLTGGVSLARAKKDLLGAVPINDQELSNQEIIDRALRLLGKRQPVSREEAWILQSEIYGSWT